MNVNLLEETHSFDNKVENIELVINWINDKLTNQQLFFSHLVVNDKELYEDFENYLLHHLKEIDTITAVTKTTEEFINDLIVSLHDYSNRALPSIKLLVEQFYQSPVEETWSMLHDLLEGLEWIYGTIKTLNEANKSNELYSNLFIAANTLEVELPNLLEAMENNDFILIGDIISYEILPQIEGIKILTEEYFHSLNK